MWMAIRGALKLQWRPSKSSLFLPFSSSPTVGVGGAVADELNGYTVIMEGKAEILLPDSNVVFYNKAQELPDAPLFVSLHNLCTTLNCTTPPAVMFPSAVINAGYRISGSHVTSLALKTDAPMSVIWDIMRGWVKNHPVKPQSPDHPGTVILSKNPTLQANVALIEASQRKGQAKKGARFLPNPESHWAPSVRAGQHITNKHTSHLGLHDISGFIHCEGNRGSQLVL